MARKLCLGVTGLRRSGKTVFISALVNLLVNGGRRNGIACIEEERFLGAEVASESPLGTRKFRYESHIDKILEDNKWPDVTRGLSALRLTVDYKSKSIFGVNIGSSRTHIDILDYPGEWLLDLPLLNKSFSEWSRESILQSNHSFRKDLALEWRNYLSEVDPDSSYNTEIAENLVNKFRDYLLECRKSDHTISRMPPGRFLEADDLEIGSDCMTFAPMDIDSSFEFKPGTIGERFQRNYNLYKKEIVEPFFKKYFSILDRQIILIDALPAISAGPDSISDLKHSLSEIFECFNIGKHNWLDKVLFRRKIDKILIAATKADHILSSVHRNYRNILKDLVHYPIKKAEEEDLDVKVEVLTSIRSTNEIKKNNGERGGITGIPLKGEMFDGVEFDGKRKIGFFPNEFPSTFDSLLEEHYPQQFIRFRPIFSIKDGQKKEIPHIGLDRAIEYILGDYLK